MMNSINSRNKTDKFIHIEKELEKFYDENKKVFETKNFDLEKFSLKDISVSFLNQESFYCLSYDEKYLVVFLYNKFREDELLKSILEIDVKLVLDAINFAYINKVKVIQNIDKIIEELYNYDVNSVFYKELMEGVKKYLSEKKQYIYDKIKEKEREIMQLKKEQELLDAFVNVLNVN